MSALPSDMVSQPGDVAKCQQRTLASAAGSGHSGFAIGLFNRRGVRARMPTDGGGQERDEAAKYRSDAKPSALLWPRTRWVLERVAAGYEVDAEREDQSAEQRDWWDW
jgi:hypothetical protein